MATITINSTVADCISITGIVKELCDKFDILNKGSNVNKEYL